MKNLKNLIQTILVLSLWVLCQNTSAQRKMEALDRGVVAVQSGNDIYVGWRILSSELRNVTYNIYRDGVKINTAPITGASNYVDTSGSSSSKYSVSAIIDGTEQNTSNEVAVWSNQYLDIPIDNSTYPATKYSISDASVGDLDGDGQFEVVIKRLANDKTQYTTDYNLLEAYKLDGTHMWTINLGPNMNDGTEINFLVYDFNGDGKAEIATRTSDGFTDGTGTYVGDRDGDGKVNYQYSFVYNSSYYRTEGPDYISIFEGETGKELAWDNYIALAPISQWGTPGMSLSQYGHRANKCMWTVAYLDGKTPSIVNGRGIYHRIKLEAWNWDGTNLSKQWAWDSNPNGAATSYTGQGNHNLSCADVDNDGCDEIVYGAMVVNNDGTGLYSTGFGHGDAIHVSAMDPDHYGLKTWQCLEGGNTWGATLRNSIDGELLIRYRSNRDCGRAAAGDINPNKTGWEMWAATECPMYNVDGSVVGSNNVAMSQMIWWDGDLSREFLDHYNFSSTSGYGTPEITKYNPTTLSAYRLLLATGMASNNWTKGNPCLQADVLGDWREEFIVRSADNTFFRIYTTTNVTDFRMPTLMHEPQYRIAVAWQNNSYNQPPHTAIYMGSETEEAVPYPTINNKTAWVSGPNWGDGSASWIDEDGNSTSYANGADVLFDFLGDNSSAVNITSAVSPRSVTVFSQNNYTFEGTGKLTGAMELLKAGTGSLNLNSDNDYTGTTKVYNGNLIINQSLSASPVEVGMYGQLFINGSIGNSVKIMSRGKLNAGSESSSAGTGSIGNGLTLESESKCYFDLSSSSDGDNDLLAVTGDVTISGLVHLTINRTANTLDPGIYPLITFDGSFNGSIDDIELLGVNDVACQIIQTENSIALEVLEVRESTELVWSGSKSNIWDFAGDYNWLNNNTEDWFLGNDVVNFTDAGVEKTIDITENVPVGNMVIDATSDYTFDGDGIISGEGGLTKQNTGRLYINNNNDFTGPVVLNGGYVSVPFISNGNTPGPLGASSGEASNFTVNQTTMYLGSSFSTNRNITIGDNNAQFYIAGPATVTMGGTFTGNGTLIKAGPGTLNISESNTHYATTISDGSIVLGSEAANTGGVGELLTLRNATLSMQNSTGTGTTANWDIDVPLGYYGTINMDGRCDFGGLLTGSGTLNLNTPYVRSHINGDWSTFEGQLNFTTTNGGWFICGNSAGYPNAAINLGDNVFGVYRHSSDAIIEIGELTGASSSELGSGEAGATTITWKVGGKNTDATFDGKITNTAYKNAGAQTAIIKTGSGKWSLTNANSYTGGTIIEAGTLIVANTTGSATGIGSISVEAAASLAGTGAVTGQVTVHADGNLRPGPTSGNGKLTMYNGLIFENGSNLYIKVNPLAGTYDMVSVNGNVVLNTSLNFTKIRGSYAAGQSYQIFDASSISGQIISISPESPGEGLFWDTSELYTSGIIKVTDTPTGIFENKYSNLEIYPNPSNGEININLSDMSGTGIISVENMGGSNVYTGTIEGGSKTPISLSQLPSGVYIVKIQINNKYYINKIIIS
nr:autotransporter-associated beta strand repeat-containing protein [uncultured Carboxylicivirga sp.]